MLRAQSVPTQPLEFAELIEHRILQRTWGRVHRLKVDVDGERVVVSGCASCYYVKQLALEGILDVVNPNSPPQIELDIEVTANSPSVMWRDYERAEPHLASY